MERYITELEKMYLLEVKSFYSIFFATEEEMEAFFLRVFRFDWDERKPRRMLFQVQRFVSLATDIDVIRKDRDGLKLLFFKCCMESLACLTGIKKKLFFEKFATYFSDEGKQYILDNFSLTFIESTELMGIRKYFGELTMDDILSIIKAARDLVVHEGNYWELQIFAYDNDSHWLTHIETKKQLLTKETYANSDNQLVTYHFETTLQYEKFQFYFVEACINLISEYMDGKGNA